MNAAFFSFLRVASITFGFLPAAIAQSVDFRNNQSDFPTPADRDVYCVFVPLVGTNFQARLLYGSDANSLQPATYTTPARFRNITAGLALAGTWVGGNLNRTLAGFTAGQTVTLLVQVWDSTGDVTFDQARAAGFFWAQSAPFTYAIPAPGSHPTAFYMDNFRAFSTLGAPCCIPEPSGVTLVMIGGLTSFLVMRLRRQRAA